MMAELAIGSPSALSLVPSQKKHRHHHSDHYVSHGRFTAFVCTTARSLPECRLRAESFGAQMPIFINPMLRLHQLEQLPVQGKNIGSQKLVCRLLGENSTCELASLKRKQIHFKQGNVSLGSKIESNSGLLRSSCSSRQGFREMYNKIVRASAPLGGNNQPHATANSIVVPDGIGFESMSSRTMEEHSLHDAMENLQLSRLPLHPKICRGELKNGLRYVILPNKVPANRFEAHMEMHVGSVDEQEHEQGIAHMIEHVAFLGSKKREQLLGSGARSNAYTDFHHTVFHVHAPLMVQGTDDPMLPRVLEALREIAFMPKIMESRVEKERRAILSELQMMNTIEYRVDCQLLQQLHVENMLGHRFPIGLEEQIKRWDVETIRAFHERWYFPSNATLYIVGDIDNVSRTIEQIKGVFEEIPAGVFPGSLNSSVTAGPTAHLQLPKLQSFLAGIVDHPAPTTLIPPPKRKERHAIRPPVQHSWSLPAGGGIRRPHIFQHELLQNFSLSLFCKKPVQKVVTYADLREVLMRRIVLSTMQFRINNRYKQANPPFTGIELDHSDSGREGCSVSTLTITAEPRKWRAAVKVAVQEVRRLKEYGITMGELTRYSSALLKDSEHLAAMVDNVPSLDNLDFIMESDALGHTVMDQRQSHESLLAVAQTITLKDVNKVCTSLLEYIADFGKSSAPLPAAIVACVPKSIHEEGIGDVSFNISCGDLVSTLKEGLEEPLMPEPELQVPKELIPKSLLEELKRLRRPCFVSSNDSCSSMQVYDTATGVCQKQLSNGIRVNYKFSKNEAKGGVMRLVVPGGRAWETVEASGAVAVGMRTLSEGSTVGNLAREQVELFCVSHLINCMLEADEEFICMDFRFTLREGGMRATFELLHMILEHNVWVEDALDRAKQMYLTFYRAMPKSLERATANRLMRVMLGGEERFVEPTPEALEKLTLPVVKEAILQQLVTSNMEVNIVGDFTEEELESCLLDYLGTVSPSVADASLESKERPIIVKPQPNPDIMHQKVFLKDTDERACAYVAGAAPNRWGMTADGRDLNYSIERTSYASKEEAEALAVRGVEVVVDKDGLYCFKQKRHPLYSCVCLTLLAEIINARLFTSVRDALGLSYDVSFEMSLFDRLKGGWFVITVTSTPAKVNKAVEASIKVLRDIVASPINQRELDRARRTLMMRHESDSKDNNYWLGLLTHSQSPYVSRKDISCIRDLFPQYEAATIADVVNAYNLLSVDDGSIFTCIGIAGNSTKEITSVVDDDHRDITTLPGSGLHGRGMSIMTRPTM